MNDGEATSSLRVIRSKFLMDVKNGVSDRSDVVLDGGRSTRWNPGLLYRQNVKSPVADDVMENRCFLHAQPDVEGPETNEVLLRRAWFGLDVTAGE